MRMKYDTFRTALIAMLVIVILFLAVIGITITVKNIKQKNEAKRLEMKPIEQEQSVYGDEDLGISPEVDEQLKDYRNIALLGIDTERIEDKAGNRSDAIVIVSIHRKTKEVKIFSVYRDTYLKVDHIHDLDKVNHAYAYGGYEQTLKVLNQNLELNIRQVIVIPWEAVRKIVDAMGGVDIELQSSEVAYMNKSLAGKDKIKGAGWQMLNGNQAVLYSRIRKDSAQGDHRRNERFKAVLLAAFEKAHDYELDEMVEIMEEAIYDIDSNMQNIDMMEVFFDMSYEIQNSFEWPYDKKGMMYNSVYYLVPTTLESNVVRLHYELFGQEDYQVGEFVQEVSQSIIDRSGYQ